MNIEHLSIYLVQLLLKHKCIKEKDILNLYDNVDCNKLYEHMHIKLEALGYNLTNELINGEEHLIIQCDNFQNILHDLDGEVKKDINRDENNLPILDIKEKYLFNSKLKKSDILIYYVIVNYIISNKKCLKLKDDSITYKTICSDYNIKNKIHQNMLLEKLIINEWLKKNDQDELDLGKRFYIDLYKYLPVEGFEICSLCNNPIIVQFKKCKNCSVIYHEHCYFTLSNRLLSCSECKESL